MRYHGVLRNVTNLEGVQRHVRQRRYGPIPQAMNTSLREQKRLQHPAGMNWYVSSAIAIWCAI